MSMALLGAGLGVDGAAAVGGNVVDITDNGSAFARIRTDQSHGLLDTQQIVVAGSDVPWYNQTHTITNVVSETEIDTDVEYTEAATGGTWSLV